MKGLDLSKLKKVSSDEKTTTFKHANGHELKVAHSGLSLKLLKELQSLPMHAKKMAAGGDSSGDQSDDIINQPTSSSIQDNPEQISAEAQAGSEQAQSSQQKQNLINYYSSVPGGIGESAENRANDALQAIDEYNSDPNSVSNFQAAHVKDLMKIASSPASAAASPQNLQNQPQPGPAPASVQPSQQAEPEDQEEDETENNSPGAQIPAPAAAQPQPQPQGPQNPISTPLDANTIANQENQNYAAFKQQIADGSIHPKTLSQMFAKNEDGSDRGTLGKIGMFFSMLAAGMGSGLTHQPNVLMTAMQNEINNDLDAQKATKTNQFNAWNAASQHVQNLSSINLQSLQAKLYQAEAANQPILAQKYRSEIAVNNANAQVYKNNSAMTGMLLAGLNHTGGIVSNMPPGPMKNQAMAAHQYMSNAVDHKVMQNNQQTGQQIEDNWKRQNMLYSAIPGAGASLAKWQQEHHIPGQEQYTSAEVSPQDRTQLAGMDALDNQIGALQSFIKAHPAGEWSPSDLARGQQMAAEITPLYSQTLGGDLSMGRQEWLGQQIHDNPAGLFSQLAGSPAKIQEIKDANERRRESIMGKLYGSGNAPQRQQQESSPGAAPEIRRMYKGRVAVYDQNKKFLRYE